MFAFKHCQREFRRDLMGHRLDNTEYLDFSNENCSGMGAYSLVISSRGNKTAKAEWAFAEI
jgi:hypothetical protein